VLRLFSTLKDKILPPLPGAVHGLPFLPTDPSVGYILSSRRDSGPAKRPSRTEIQRPWRCKSRKSGAPGIGRSRDSPGGRTRGSPGGTKEPSPPQKRWDAEQGMPQPRKGRHSGLNPHKVPEGKQRESPLQSNIIRTGFHRRIQQFLTFAAPCLSNFCMKPYGKPNRTFKQSNYPLRLKASVMAEARRVAKSKGVSLN
jgi:hypothetical protein